MSREASNKAQREIWEADDPSQRSEPESTDSKEGSDQDQPATDRAATGETVVKTDKPDSDDRSDAWGVHVDSMKAKWSNLESELPEDQLPDKNDQGEGPLGEKGGRDDDADLPGDEPGSWRGDSNQYLNLEENYSVDRAFGRMSDRETNVTDNLRTGETEVVDAKLVALEHRLKGKERFKEKVAEQLAVEYREDPRRAAESIPDGLRYTYQIPADSYVQGQQEVVDQLKEKGYEMIYRKNSWNDPEYKGINSRWRTPDGQLFEVQFHTPESFEAKQLTHGAYERLRSPLTSGHDVLKLESFQREVSAGIPVPDNVLDIPNYRKSEG